MIDRIEEILQEASSYFLTREVITRARYAIAVAKNTPYGNIIDLPWYYEVAFKNILKEKGYEKDLV